MGGLGTPELLIVLLVLVLLFGRRLGRVIEGAAEQPLRPSARTLEVER